MAFELDDNAANILAAIIHKVGTGDTASPAQPGDVAGSAASLGQTVQSTNAQGQAVIDQASQSSTPTTTDQTAAPAPTAQTGPATNLATAPVNQGYHGNTGGHPGIDLGVPVGTPLQALESGKVTVAGNTDPNGYGNEVEITAADGTVMRYGHLSSIGVKLGDTVRMGQSIGASGGAAGAPGSGNSTGAHLHFEVRKGGATVDPVPYLAGSGGVVSGSATSNPAAASVVVDPEAATATAILDLAAGRTPSSSLGQTQQVTSQTPNQSGATGDTDPNAIDSFLAAIRQKESGGNYQIRNTSGQSNAAGAYQFIGTTWRGLGGSGASAADASPQEQDAIARQYATSLFNQYHSWRLAAIAWYQPSAADVVARGGDPGAPAGQGRFIDYGDSIQRMMANGIGNTEPATQAAAAPSKMPYNLPAGTNQEGAAQAQAKPKTNPLSQGTSALTPPKQQQGLSSLSADQRAKFDQLQKTHKGKKISIRAESGKIVFVLPNGRKVSAGAATGGV